MMAEIKLCLTVIAIASDNFALSRLGLCYHQTKYAGGDPRLDCPDDATKEGEDCWIDGYDAGFAQVYDTELMTVLGVMMTIIIMHLGIWLCRFRTTRNRLQ